MTSKKYILLLALVVFIQAVSIGQTMTTDWGWYWKDSSKVPTAKMPQYNEFVNNQYPYPPRPRDQWELGFSAGPSWVVSDLRANTGLTGGISLRKAFDHTWSARIGYFGMLNSGYANTFETSLGAANYRNKAHVGSIDLIYSLNPGSFYRGNPKTNIYLLAGYSLIATQTQYKAPGGVQPDGYNIYYGIGQPNSQNGLITTVAGTTINGRKGWALLSGANIGAGFSFKVSNKVNLGVEQRFTFTVPGYDRLDGFGGTTNNYNDYYSYTQLRLNINLGNPAKRVQPLWWLNPYNFIYSELNNPKHMKMPPVVLPDADGDGVTDQFDLEPNTPRGAPVDSHGVARDTDGDGVPDYRDKEILTPQKCFPVDKDGVGTCPEPPCCAELRTLIQSLKREPVVVAPTCTIGNLPSIHFNKGARLSKDDERLLGNAASQLQANPNCRVKLIGYGASSKAAQQLSYDRVNAVRSYLIDKQGISEGRVLFSYGQEGDSNTVDLMGTMEDSPSTVPAPPHPNLRSK